MAEMHPATPGALRRFFVHVAIALIGGMALIALMQVAQPELLRWASADPAATRTRAQLIIVVLAILVAAPVIGAAVYMLRLGRRITREQRFPPEGLAVVRDVPVVRGAAAVRKGHVLIGAAAILLVLAALMVLSLMRLATLAPVQP